MKTLQLFIMLLFLSVLFQTNISFGLLAAKTPEELQKESDLIIIGKIEKATARNPERVTDYTITIERILKGDLKESPLQITSPGNKNSGMSVEDEPVFDQGDRVLLYLNKQRDTYSMSPYSTVLGNYTNGKVPVYSHPEPMVPIDNGSCCDYTIPIIAITLGGVALLIILVQRGKIKT